MSTTIQEDIVRLDITKKKLVKRGEMVGISPSRVGDLPMDETVFVNRLNS